MGKKCYEAPVLVCYLSLNDLTAGGPGISGIPA